MKRATILNQSQRTSPVREHPMEANSGQYARCYRRLLVYLPTLSQLQELHTLVRKYVEGHGRGIFNAIHSACRNCGKCGNIV